MFDNLRRAFRVFRPKSVDPKGKCEVVISSRDHEFNLVLHDYFKLYCKGIISCSRLHLITKAYLVRLWPKILHSSDFRYTVDYHEVYIKIHIETTNENRETVEKAFQEHPLTHMPTVRMYCLNCGQLSAESIARFPEDDGVQNYKYRCNSSVCRGADYWL